MDKILGIKTVNGQNVVACFFFGMQQTIFNRYQHTKFDRPRPYSAGGMCTRTGFLYEVGPVIIGHTGLLLVFNGSSVDVRPLVAILVDDQCIFSYTQGEPEVNIPCKFHDKRTRWSCIIHLST